ncbi:RidA family protein [Parahaliea mediterranea]|uniref:RidA family protein n=1 Tax=Parahaliea mediterranea TaxID=651086 RepID=UPI000E2F8341|nr:RidA family protein [Parahaliea mediterranea]
MIESINPPGTEFAGMSQAIRAGEWLTLAGQVALCDGKVAGVGDPYEQAVQTFRNIQAILQQAAVPVERLVQLRCYLTDRAHYADYARAKRECFPHIAPASTVVIVDGLLLEELLLEVEAVAFVGDLA